MRTLPDVARTLNLPPKTEALAARLAAEFLRAGCELYLVGGVVRDALLDAPHADDLDFATSATPDQTKRALSAAGGKVYTVGERFGTIGAVFDDLRVEVTTYRAEAYQAGSRKPDVSFRRRLSDDLARRDFTVNAIACDARTGEMEDPFAGQEDLHRGIVRAVGEPAERFQEDPLRLLRAVRFTSRLGFQLDPATASAVRHEAASLASISRERVRDELQRMLLGPAPARAIRLLCDLGLAEHSLPDLLGLRGMQQETGRHKDVFNHTLQVVDRTPPRPALRWAALLHDIGKPRTLSIQNGQVHFFGHDRVGEKMARRILGDLKLPTDLFEHVSQLVGFHLRANAYEPSWTDGAVRRFVREVGDALVEDLLALSRADVTSARAERRLAVARSVDQLERRIGELRAQEDIARLSSPLDGNDLMALFQRPPGAWIRPIKDRLLEMVLDGELAMDDRAAAEPIARRLYEELGLDDRQTAKRPA
jgi:poly(A) polymerase